MDPSPNLVSESGQADSLTLLVVATTAVVAGGDREADLAATNPAIQPTDEEWEADWTADFSERLAGEMPDGTPWLVEIEADSVEVCYEVGTATGCGVPRVIVTIGTTGAHQLVYGLVNQGPYEIATGERVRAPATIVELELSDGTIVSAEHVGQRLWATVLPSNTRLRDSLRQRWDDGMSAWGTNEIEDVPAPNDEDRRAAEVEARREAERRRMAEREQLAEFQRRMAATTRQSQKAPVEP